VGSVHSVCVHKARACVLCVRACVFCRLWKTQTRAELLDNQCFDTRKKRKYSATIISEVHGYK